MRSAQALQEKPGPPFIHVTNRETFKRTFDDSPRIPPHDISPGIHTASRSLIDNSSMNTSKQGWAEGDIDLYVSIPLDDDYDSDFTPPVTPRMLGCPGHVRIASGRSHGDSVMLQVSPSQVNRSPKPVQVQSPDNLGFHLDQPILKVPKILHPHSQPGQSRPAYKQDLPTPSPDRPYSQLSPSPPRSAFSEDLSVDPSIRSSEVENLPVPVKHTHLGPPNFTDPFAENRPLKALPRLTEKDYKPPLKSILKAQASREQSNKESDSCRCI